MDEKTDVMQFMAEVLIKAQMIEICGREDAKTDECTTIAAACATRLEPVADAFDEIFAMWMSISDLPENSPEKQSCRWLLFRCIGKCTELWDQR
jgi:hypothetical protein